MARKAVLESEEDSPVKPARTGRGNPGKSPLGKRDAGSQLRDEEEAPNASAMDIAPQGDSGRGADGPAQTASAPAPALPPVSVLGIAAASPAVKGAAAKAQRQAAARAQGVGGTELPLVIPEALPRGKVLVEAPEDELGLTDLSGDAGAVGRLVVVEVDGQKASGGGGRANS